MKKVFIAAVLLAAGAFSAHSQTKGTNSLGFGFGTYNSSSEWASDIGTSESKGKGLGVNVNYGRFIKDNTKLSVFLGYSHTKNESEFQVHNQFQNQIVGREV